MERIPPALAPIGYIPGLMYEAVIRARNWSYSAGARAQHHLSRPVISIGNITMGGSGKTPLVVHIAKKLADQGFGIAILTRGYARENPKASLILPPGQIVANPALALGDEPALMRRKLPGAWMGISRRRFLAGRAIEKEKAPTAFVLDDGFQHRQLFRDLDIVILDLSQPLEANRLFPLGTLREPLSGLGRAHAIVLNGFSDSIAFGKFLEKLRGLAPKANFFRCTQTIDTLIPFSLWTETQSSTHRGELPNSAYLVSAIGNPQRFYRDIRDRGIDVRGFKFFRDHHRLEPEDWAICRKEAQACGANAILITEKDAIKIQQPPDFPLQVAVQKVELSDADSFNHMLLRCIGRHGEFTGNAKD